MIGSGSWLLQTCPYPAANSPKAGVNMQREMHNPKQHTGQHSLSRLHVCHTFARQTSYSASGSCL